MTELNRRRFLQAGGAAAVLGTAGCDAPHKALWPYTGLPKEAKPPFAPSNGESIDLTTHVLNRLTFGTRPGQTSVVVMTEFGRRVSENSALGTDHGRGGAMYVLGGDGAEGRVIADWPGLKRDALVGPGDLPVTTDYRDVLIPVLRRHAPDADMARVFPGHEAKPLGQAAESA